MDIKRLFAASLLASAVSIASAGEGTSLLTTCVDLGADREIMRPADTSSFMLRDGEVHYRVALRGTCNGMRSADVVSIGTRGVPGRVCPRGAPGSRPGTRSAA
ncbi:hypothetical protein H1235_08975 [Pseudoxanthomonas sp. NC8]|nr:hypothetical protein H1235_08975 [Pseudoxanthomonas sp. NC8]